jgi:hypothetical protein
LAALRAAKKEIEGAILLDQFQTDKRATGQIEEINRRIDKAEGKEPTPIIHERPGLEQDVSDRVDRVRREQDKTRPAEVAAPAPPPAAAEDEKHLAAKKSPSAAESKLTIEFLKAQREVADKLAKATTEDLQAEYMKRADKINKYYAEDMENLKKAEAKKLEAHLKTIREAGAEHEQGLRESSEEQVANLVGRGTTVSSLARVGGFVGPQRGGLASADRQLQTLREHTRLQQSIADNTERTAELIERAASVAAGDLTN